MTKNQQIYIAAQPGFFVVTHDVLFDLDTPSTELYKEPILAWMLGIEQTDEEEFPYSNVNPITIDGITDGTIEKPDGSFTTLQDETFNNEAALLKHINEFRQRKCEYGEFV